MKYSVYAVIPKTVGITGGAMTWVDAESEDEAKAIAQVKLNALGQEQWKTDLEVLSVWQTTV